MRYAGGPAGGFPSLNHAAGYEDFGWFFSCLFFSSCFCCSAFCFLLLSLFFLPPLSPIASSFPIHRVSQLRPRINLCPTQWLVYRPLSTNFDVDTSCRGPPHGMRGLDSAILPFGTFQSIRFVIICWHIESIASGQSASGSDNASGQVFSECVFLPPLWLPDGLFQPHLLAGLHPGPFLGSPGK